MRKVSGCAGRQLELCMIVFARPITCLFFSAGSVVALDVLQGVLHVSVCCPLISLTVYTKVYAVFK